MKHFLRAQMLVAVLPLDQGFSMPMLPSYYSFVLPSITGWVELGFRVCWRVWLWGEGPCPPGLDFSQKPFQFCKLSTL